MPKPRSDYRVLCVDVENEDDLLQCGVWAYLLRPSSFGTFTGALLADHLGPASVAHSLRSYRPHQARELEEFAVEVIRLDTDLTSCCPINRQFLSSIIRFGCGLSC